LSVDLIIMLTEKELNKIFSWQPYRSDWPVDRNQKEDNITVYYGGLISQITQNELFNCHYSEDGGLGNYLEFICYPRSLEDYNGGAVLVCVSLCAPIAAYGQITCNKAKHSFDGGFISPEEVGQIPDAELLPIKTGIDRILTGYNLTLIDKEFACRLLPDEVTENLRRENHNEGNQYLHGLFQKID